MNHEQTNAPRKESLEQDPRKSEGRQGGQGKNGKKEDEIRPLMIVQVLGEDFLYIHGRMWVKLTDEVLWDLRAKAEARLRQLSTPQAD